MKRVIIETTVEITSYRKVEVIKTETQEVIKHTRILEFPNGDRVLIPINRDGTVKWFDDSRLIRRQVNDAEV